MEQFLNSTHYHGDRQGRITRQYIWLADRPVVWRG